MTQHSTYLIQQDTIKAIFVGHMFSRAQIGKINRESKTTKESSSPRAKTCTRSLLFLAMCPMPSSHRSLTLIQTKLTCFLPFLFPHLVSIDLLKPSHSAPTRSPAESCIFSGSIPSFKKIEFSSTRSLNKTANQQNHSA